MAYAGHKSSKAKHPQPTSLFIHHRFLHCIRTLSLASTGLEQISNENVFLPSPTLTTPIDMFINFDFVQIDDVIEIF